MAGPSPTYDQLLVDILVKARELYTRRDDSRDGVDLTTVLNRVWSRVKARRRSSWVKDKLAENPDNTPPAATD